MIQKPSAEQRLLAVRLEQLSTQLLAAYRPTNDPAHVFERTGWLLLRAAVVMISGGDKAHRLAADWAARGFPSGTNEPFTSSAGELTSVERASIESDEWDIRRNDLNWLRHELENHAIQVESMIAHTIAVKPNEGRRTTLIDCVNPHCQTVMTGLGEDRPKEGRCPRCYQFRLRNRRDWTPNGIDVVTTPNAQVSDLIT